MDNSYTDFGISFGIFVAGSQILDFFTLKLGYVEFASMWAGVVAVLLVGFGIAVYRKIKHE